MWPYSREFTDVAYMNLSPQWIFNPHSESFKANPFWYSVGNVVLSLSLSHLSFTCFAFLLSISISPYLSVIWTSCSVALKYCKSCRSVDHHSVLHLESECNVNDMMIPSKAMLTLLSFSFFKWKVTLWDNDVNSKLHFNNAEVVLAEHTTKTS